MFKKSNGFANLFLKEAMMKSGVNHTAQGQIESALKVERITKSNGFTIDKSPEPGGGFSVTLIYKDKSSDAAKKFLASLRGGAGHDYSVGLDSKTETQEKYISRGKSTIQSSHKEENGIHTLTVTMSKVKDRQHFDGSLHDY